MLMCSIIEDSPGGCMWLSRLLLWSHRGGEPWTWSGNASYFIKSNALFAFHIYTSPWMVHKFTVYHDLLRTIDQDFESLGGAREWCNVVAGQGLGYARSTMDELIYLHRVSSNTGIILDPVKSMIWRRILHLTVHDTLCVPNTPQHSLNSPSILLIFQRCTLAKHYTTFHKLTNAKKVESRKEIQYSLYTQVRIHVWSINGMYAVFVAFLISRNWHFSGGMFGLYDKSSQLSKIISGTSDGVGGGTDALITKMDISLP